AADGQLLGLVDVGTARRVPLARRATTTTGEISLQRPSLVVDEHQDVAELLARAEFQELGRAVVLTSSGELGIVSISDVEAVLRALDLAAA
ncbi:MAG: hypothetical protein AB7T48_14065, partial [Solirubrobacterales bacterium]